MVVIGGAYLEGRTPHVGRQTAGISSSCSAALRQDGLAIRARQLRKLPTIGFLGANTLSSDSQKVAEPLIE
jgi:hypothetical protein